MALEPTRPRPTLAREGDIRLANRGTHARLMLSVSQVEVRAPDGRALFRIPRLTIFQQDRVVLLGPNGVGKSQLVQLLRRALTGEAVAGLCVSASIVMGYVDQLMSHLPDALTPHGFISARFRIEDQRTIRLLAGAGFTLDMQRRTIKQLSLGQKARLGLLALRLTEPNFYLMDEPTNHIDITGQERLEQEILSQEATCVIVSHDRAFVQTIGTRFLSIENGSHGARKYGRISHNLEPDYDPQYLSIGLEGAAPTQRLRNPHFSAAATLCSVRPAGERDRRV